MKAIETKYKGYRFRSRLEARWAVFFDAIGWRWEYEPEGFDLGFGELYLPDFRIRRDYIEIKAAAPTEAEKRKAMLLARGANCCVAFGVGLPDPADVSGGLPGYTESGTYTLGLLSLDNYCFQKWGRPGYCVGNTAEEDDFDACEAARSARFEHGESGARL